ncbi:DET1 homolog [Orussus abietinus]|uniref:DET1 homolog n=1 Tax=Orussus abietinus TaxID=222816 RepID=UPI000625E2F4|nr:DET1 homolog [Orussus abietinus]XP_023290807.1 DET1 homolog [Orussus abietinus]XP_023290808.1 DET1 homolog [Orussus abietinus]
MAKEEGRIEFVTDPCPIKPRKIGPQNLVIRLRRRETLGCLYPGTQIIDARQFYQNIYPNFTVVNVEKPLCFLRKFSPDGKYLIAFSADQTSIEVYEYRGASAAADLLVDCKGEYVGHKHDSHSCFIRSNIFNRFFKIKWIVNLVHSNGQLNRECSLFTEDGRYVIVGSAAYVSEISPYFYQIYSNNEALTPNPRLPLEDYSLYLVDLHHGIFRDSRHFKVDKIYLSHNKGLYLYKNILAVLSVQHQTIHIFKIVNGTIINVRKIGRFCLEDDAYLVTSTWPGANFRPFRDVTINSLKHKLLVYLYKRAEYISNLTKDPYELRRFYQYFDQLNALRMWKMQLLDTDHILVRYASEEVATLQANDPNAQPALLVVYDMVAAKILAAYDNTSTQLLTQFENFGDFFSTDYCQFMCSPSNNIYARLMRQRFKQTIVSARYGGITEATKRLLALLPICAQSYSSSPYLDLSLFCYDPKWVSMLERPKACGEHPIRFYARDSGLLKFRMYAGIPGKTTPLVERQLVTFTFHPTDPFTISVQRTNDRYIVNFHVQHL